jgi:hypothetical protein
MRESSDMSGVLQLPERRLQCQLKTWKIISLDIL